ncbi:phospho-2-dehydro-3-deoxyheptonate aldolase [endosymbiont of Sipalinus gigas]|uniref:3-deoxy-7-phosphoheptulonate synthase n=1 Tax=endosymbiont of Sipalinus gigas TaxID=1972134 RepID=UPI000DC6E6E3|nr:3-deoxy-7-phosphoheptulonate synthase [endosymbiont of Sipalinus gigas]BBA85214.1 phospho-2-dehydro-3-deoxyheptonate aldolase [endosymbiont of Sipalinus gigas]
MNTNCFNFLKEKDFISPNLLKNKFNIYKNININILEYRNIISNIINKLDNRLLIICGPCSVNNRESLIEYANNFKNLSLKVNDYLYLVIRAYYEKPRTTVGWKGIIYDPDINGSNDIEKGIYTFREILLDLFNISIPVASEILNPIFIRYFGDLLSWVSIGARTSESQIHREIISGLNIPVGFKNSTDGSIDSCVNSIISSKNSHNFIYINEYGKLSYVKTLGNLNSHIILRGGKNGPNYFYENIDEYIKILDKNKLNKSILIDCSHDNSNKNYKNQINVVNNIIKQLKNNKYIIGLMIESNLNEGNQSFDLYDKNKNIKYGVSITDSCINWKDTEDLIYKIYYEYKNICNNRQNEK